MHIPIAFLHRGDAIPEAGGAMAEVLWPTNAATDSYLDDNDTSTVIRLTWQGRSVLLTGDIAEGGESGLLHQGGLKADVLFLPHHGSTRAAPLPSLVAAADPSILLRSSGQRDGDTNAFLWSAIGTRNYYNTAECGAICTTVTADGIQTETFRSSTGQPKTKSAR